MLRVKKTDVAVVPIFDPPKTKGGLIIPEIAKERSDQGIVKYIGSEVDKEIDISYGDHVMFAAYDGTLTRIDGEGLLIILPASKIVAVIQPPETRIDGIYFKSKLAQNEIDEQAEEIMLLTGCTKHQALQVLLSGYGKNIYWPCTYEMTIELIAEAITNADWKEQFRFKERKAASPSASSVF